MSLFSLIADILFVGHSLVGHSLPAMTDSALRHRGAGVQVEAQIINGAPLRFNWDNSAGAEGVDARAVLPSGRVGHLILTEALPLAEHVTWNDSGGHVARFHGLATEANPDAQVWLYETWHSLDSGAGADIPHDKDADIPWRERLDRDLALWHEVLSEANAARAGGAPVRLIPAGQAMALLHDEIAAGRAPGLTDIRQAFSDHIHPNDIGFYLVAMVIHASLTGESPEGLPPRLVRVWESRDTVVSDDLAAALQRIAWRAVRDYAPPDDRADLPAPAPVETAADPPEAPPALTGIANPNLAMGLNGINDWSVQQPFLDVMKTARPWIGHRPGQWGGWGHDDLAAGGYLDADGWPVAIPRELSGIATLILTDLPPAARSTEGRYRLRHEGGGRLRIEGRAQNIDRHDDGASFDFAPGAGGVILTLTATDPDDPIRNITVVREDRLERHAAGEIFNPDWLARIRGLRLIRFMDWMSTNDSTVSTPADRPRPDDYTYARNGAPMEVMLALANELGADAWFTVPHLADDDLIRELAVLARGGLAPGLRAWVEFSNEVWNWQFAQARWAEEQGVARWGGEHRWVQFYALRATEMAAIWAEVFGAEAPDRLVRVIATQTGWRGLEEDILTAPLWRAEDPAIRPPAEAFDAYAVTGYFSAMLGGDEKVPLVLDWLAESRAAAETGAAERGLIGQERMDYQARHRYDLAVARALAELRDGSVTGDPADSLARLLEEVLPHHARVAGEHGLRLAMYEGGTHVVGLGRQVENEVLTAFFTHLNYTPGMAALYRDLLEGWRRLTDEPFNAFVDVAAPSRWGSWGALRHLTDENPRWQALTGAP